MIKILEWESITVQGTMQGALWWPIGEHFTKQFSEKFTRVQTLNSHEWNGIREALSQITNDGDSCGGDLVLECSLTIVYKNLFNHAKIIRHTGLPVGEEIADLFISRNCSNRIYV